MEKDKKDKNSMTEIKAEREFAEFIKESRDKAELHKLIAIAAQSYIDGIQIALRCQQATTAQ